MESTVKLKNSLRTPIRKLTSCVSGVKEKRLCDKRRIKRRRAGGGGNRMGLGKTPPPQTAYTKDSLVIRWYQADLEKQRQLREAMNTQKKAERAAMRAHFRKKYQLPENRKDLKHLKSVGDKVSLPHDLSKIIHPETKTKDDGFNLLSAFQGLSFSTAVFTGRKHSKTPTPTTHGNS
ncbi:uncharacterized protein KZ484_025932 [Pholidichthys leucotaenia]